MLRDISGITSEIEQLELDINAHLTWGDLTSEQRDKLTRASNLIGLAVSRLNENPTLPSPLPASYNENL